MSYCDVFVVITCEKSSGASFLDKSMKKELYGLGCSHTIAAKISMAKSTFFCFKGAQGSQEPLFFPDIIIM